MTELMDDDVPQNLWREQYQAPVERQIPNARTTAPLRALIADREPLEPHAYHRRERIGLALDHGDRLLADPFLHRTLHLARVSERELNAKLASGQLDLGSTHS